MSYTTIDDPTKFFSTTLWTGNGTSTSITTGHATDWLWIKNRNDTQKLLSLICLVHLIVMVLL
jgi:hypothetical protein